MNIMAREQAILDAALLWALCPEEGQYDDGPSLEETCERLLFAVADYLGIDFADAPPERWSVEEMQAFVGQLRQQWGAA